VETSPDSSEEFEAPTPNHILPSADHRYRPTPAFLTPDPIERLVEPPQPLSDSATVPTENGANDPRLLERVTRAWAKSFGAGPVWELLEDRGWYKETSQMEDQHTSRPLVHSASENTTVWEDLDFKRVDTTLRFYSLN
jgi:transcription factor C subunit 6